MVRHCRALCSNLHLLPFVSCDDILQMTSDIEGHKGMEGLYIVQPLHARLDLQYCQQLPETQHELH